MAKDIGRIIKERREFLGLTLKDIAEALKVSESTVSRYESKDIQNMGIDKIAQLAKILQCSPSILMGWVLDDNVIYSEIEEYKARARAVLEDENASLEDKYDAVLAEYLALFGRSERHSEKMGTFHVSSDDYIAMLLNQNHQKKRMPIEVYALLKKKYGTKDGIPNGECYFYESEPQEEYYLDPEAAAYAQEIYEDPDLRLLFDASRKVSKDDLKTVVDLVKRMKGADED